MDENGRRNAECGMRNAECKAITYERCCMCVEKLMVENTGA